MLLEAHVLVAIDFIAAVAALIFAVANVRRTDAFSVAALIFTGLACERSTRDGLIAAIAAVVLAVATPEERNAFLRCGAFELRGRAISDASLAILGQIELIGTFAFVEWFDWRQQTQCVAFGCRARIMLGRSLAIRVIHANVHRSMNGRQNGGAIVATIFVTRFN